MEPTRGGFQSHLAEGENAMLGASAEITEILSVETILSGRRGEEVRILHDVALELAAAIELESARSDALQGAASRDIDPPTRGHP